MKLNDYLKQIQYEQIIKKDDSLKCTVCGRGVNILKSGKGPLVCCMKQMVLIKRSLSEAEGWEGLPKGWDMDSVRKFAKSLTGKKGTEEGFFDKCVKKMKDEKGFNKDKANKFCATIKDELHGSTFWRGKGKTPEEAEKDVKKHQNVEKG